MAPKRGPDARETSSLAAIRPLSQSRAPAGAGLAEACAVWALLGLFCGAIFWTYARLPARDFFHVSTSGPGGGAGRALVFVNFPVALVAIAVVLIVIDRLQGRTAVTAAVLAVGLCAAVFWPGVVDQRDLDARWVNAIAALGVALALGLTLAAARGGVGAVARAPGANPFARPRDDASAARAGLPRPLPGGDARVRACERGPGRLGRAAREARRGRLGDPGRAGARADPRVRRGDRCGRAPLPARLPPAPPAAGGGGAPGAGAGVRRAGGRGGRSRRPRRDCGRPHHPHAAARAGRAAPAARRGADRLPDGRPWLGPDRRAWRRRRPAEPDAGRRP